MNFLTLISLSIFLDKTTFTLWVHKTNPYFHFHMHLYIYIPYIYLYAFVFFVYIYICIYICILPVPNLEYFTF